MSSEVDFETLAVEETEGGPHSVRLVSIISTDETWGRQAIEKYLQTHEEETTAQLSNELGENQERRTTSKQSPAHKYWCDGDKATRYCMTACGLLSGYPCGIRRDCLRQATSAYHLFVCLVFVANFAVGLRKSAIDAASNSAGQDASLLLMINSVWRAQVSLCTCLMLITCLRENGLDTFYRQLLICVKQTPSISSAYEIKSFKTFHQLLTAGGFLMCIMLLVPKIIVLNANINTKGVEVYEMINFVGDSIMITHYSFFSSFVASICLTNWYMLRTLNYKFKQYMRKSRHQHTADRLNEYRKAHLRLQKLRRVSSDFLSLFLFVFFTGSITLWLLVTRYSFYMDTTTGRDWYLQIGYYIPPSALSFMAILTISEWSSAEVRLRAINFPLLLKIVCL